MASQGGQEEGRVWAAVCGGSFADLAAVVTDLNSAYRTRRDEWAEMELTRYRRIRWRPPTASEKFFGRCGCGSGSQEPAIEEMQGPWL